MSQVEEHVKSIRPFDADWIKNSFINSITFGTVGYDSDKGKFTKGELLRPTEEAIGEITGRNMTRESLYQGYLKTEKEEQARDKMVQDERKYKQNQDIVMSNSAAGMRNASRSRARRSVVTDALNPEKDFLGL